METDTNQVAALQAEVALMRRNNRWLAVLTALIGLGLVLSVVYPVSTVQSRRYSLLDDSGRQRGMWRERDGTSALILQDDGGRWRLVAEMGPDGPRVQLHRAGGEPLVEFGARDADAVLTMHDRAGSPRLQLRVADGGGRLTFLDRNGEPVSEIGEGAQ